MSISEALAAIIAGIPEITAIVGDRIHTDVLPQTGDVPALVFYVTQGNSTNALDGPTGLDLDNVEFECYGKTRIEANNLAKLVWSKLCAVTNHQADDIHILGLHRWAGVRHTFDRTRIGTDQRRMVSMQTLRVSYQTG